LRHPLVIVIGLGLMVALGLRLVRPLSPRCIDVSDETLRGLSQDFARRTGRPPTGDEQARLVQDYLDGEVLLREAESRRLGDGDIVIRRRLIQKMEFLLEGMGGDATLSDEALAACFAAHAERYRQPARVSLQHVFLARDRHGADLPARADELKRRLADGADPRGLGDPFARGAEFFEKSEDELAAIFGPDLAAAVMAATTPVGAFSGPRPSSFGLHLVRVTARVPASLPKLEDVLPRVRSDCERLERERRRREALDRLKKSYDITVPSALQSQKGKP
jgi:hypothetical protein